MSKSRLGLVANQVESSTLFWTFIYIKITVAHHIAKRLNILISFLRDNLYEQR